MLHSILVLLGFQLLGEFISASFDLPLPGSICGMLLLLVVLIVRGRVTVPLRETANGLFRYLPLILIPPSVGVMTQWRALIEHPFALTGVIVFSTALGLAATAWLFERGLRRQQAKK